MLCRPVLCVLLAAALGTISLGCATSEPEGTRGAPAADESSAAPERHSTETLHLASASTQASPLPSPTFSRKIVRNAELSIEADDPQEVARRISSLAESRGGYVVTTELLHQADADEAAHPPSVSLVVRVPAEVFDPVVDEILRLGNHVQRASRTGQDLTEEYIDLEARLRSEGVLEAQLFELMGRATKVSDAIEVQRQLAEVRTRIEQLEGRRRYIENQSALSTIRVDVEPRRALLAASPGFARRIREAFADGLQAAVTVMATVVQLAVAVLPLLLLVGLPAFLVWRLGRRRQARGAART